MMPTILPKKLNLKYDQKVIDIIQFGSSILEGSNPNDIDIAVIYKDTSLKDQLLESQKIKIQLEKKFELPIHIKSFDLYSLFEKSNFAKHNIIFYGKSIITQDYFMKTLGLTPKINILYSLKSLEKKDKIRFNYMLNGKKSQYGILRKYGGKIVSPGLIEIYPEHKELFVTEIKKITKDFEIKEILS